MLSGYLFELPNVTGATMETSASRLDGGRRRNYMTDADYQKCRQRRESSFGLVHDRDWPALIALLPRR